jgi:chemotaxis protein CheX
MLRHLLISTGELDQSSDSLLDVIGEMANTISGNARRYFGDGMEWR